MHAKSRAPHFVDRHVGQRIKERRVHCGMSQMAVAEKIGKTYQQLQKYETAQNRVSPSVLYKIAQALGVQPTYFFDNLDSGAGKHTPPIEPIPLWWHRLYHTLGDDERKAVRSFSRVLSVNRQ